MWRLRPRGLISEYFSMESTQQSVQANINSSKTFTIAGHKNGLHASEYWAEVRRARPWRPKRRLIAWPLNQDGTQNVFQNFGGLPFLSRSPNIDRHTFCFEQIKPLL